MHLLKVKFRRHINCWPICLASRRSTETDSISDHWGWRRLVCSALARRLPRIYRSVCPDPPNHTGEDDDGNNNNHAETRPATMYWHFFFKPPPPRRWCKRQLRWNEPWMRTNGTDNPQQNYNNKSKTPQSSCWPWLAGWLDGVTRDRASTYNTN